MVAHNKLQAAAAKIQVKLHISKRAKGKEKGENPAPTEKTS
jgi:hypothetical protein